MIWWAMEQALAWIMWRDDARVAETGDGKAWMILPRDTAKAPELSEDETNEIARKLLEIGEVEHPRRDGDGEKTPFEWNETRVALHPASGCVAVLAVRRKGLVAPPTPVGSLYWRVPQEHPALSFEAALAELRGRLQQGCIATKAETAGRTISVATDHWIHGDLTPSIDENVGWSTFLEGQKARQLRLDSKAIVKLWPRTKMPKPLSGAAEGKNYGPIVIDETAKNMNDRIAKGRSATDDDIKATLEELSGKYDDKEGGPSPKTIGRWAKKVRGRMAEVAAGSI